MAFSFTGILSFHYEISETSTEAAVTSIDSFKVKKTFCKIYLKKNYLKNNPTAMVKLLI